MFDLMEVPATSDSFTIQMLVLPLLCQRLSVIIYLLAEKLTTSTIDSRARWRCSYHDTIFDYGPKIGPTTYPGGLDTGTIHAVCCAFLMVFSAAQTIFESIYSITSGCGLMPFIVLLVMVPVASAYDPLGRWGQAVATLQGALVVHGGKVDQLNQFSYTAAPNVNDILYLPLSSSFSATSPPWQLLNQPQIQGSALAWHTLSFFNATHGLLFGGLPSPNSDTANLAAPDSAALLDFTSPSNPQWQPQTPSWAGQPNRRIRHSSVAAPTGDIYIFGGEKADGSQNSLAEYFVFSEGTPSFSAIPAPLESPLDIYGHATVSLPDGRLVSLGGYSQSAGGLIPFNSPRVLDTSQTPPTWVTATTASGDIPPPRMAFASTVLPGNRILIHGGSDFSLQANMDDGWILDMTSMTWSRVDALSQIGARRDHFAIAVGNQTIFGFGYANDGPASGTLEIFDFDNNSFVDTFTPPPPAIPTSSIPTAQITRNTSTSPETAAPIASNPAKDPVGGGGQGSGNPDDTQRKKRRTVVAIVVGIVIVLLVLLAIVAIMLCRRRRRQCILDEKDGFLTSSMDNAERRYRSGGIAWVFNRLIHVKPPGREYERYRRYGIPAEEGEHDTLQPQRLAVTQTTNIADSEPKVTLPFNTRQATADTTNSNTVLPSPLSHHPSVTSNGSGGTAIQGLRRTVRFSYSSYPDEPALSDTISQILGNPSRQASMNEGSSSRPSPVSEVPPLPVFSRLNAGCGIS